MTESKQRFYIWYCGTTRKFELVDRENKLTEAEIYEKYLDRINNALNAQEGSEPSEDNFCDGMFRVCRTDGDREGVEMPDKITIARNSDNRGGVYVQEPSPTGRVSNARAKTNLLLWV